MPLKLQQRGASYIFVATYNRASIRHLSLWSRVKEYCQVVATDYDDTPKGIREHKDLAMALLAHTHRRLRKENPQKSVSSLLDDAIAELEDRGMEDIGVRATRYELQQELAPEVVKIFETFQKVDGILPSGSEASLDDHGAQILVQELQETLVALTNQSTLSSEHPGPESFHLRKLGALRTLLSFHGWAEMGEQVETRGRELSLTDEPTSPVDESDDFGYIATGAKKDVVDAIRRYQAWNMIRSALIRREIGHSILALKSTIPGAGRGVFLDGEAMEGSLVAFIPGEVLPKEYLTNPSASLNDYLSHDNNYQLSIRSDDILIDSRCSPYTVLDEEGSNPWSLGHVVNHPPPNVSPNCRTVMINFTEAMNLKSTGLFRYVPNTYKRKPMLFGQKLFDRDSIVMHGMAIMTRRDVSNEELFYDYKFTGDEGNPSWYHKATYEDWADERD